ncbi:hypothetical protein [Frigoribacterium sp. SL97]|uniref:hypothetical protein n=1 Tax=Frigoribacterium sp. SL97 TaxID=2994664 RepID=UPI00227044A2|nr:hypothetical protein [Frigoribacterium sp. SL97]WAC50412.1 hypothetical protein OVA02_11070 [Frigoribacterium sp. SL97]
MSELVVGDTIVDVGNERWPAGGRTIATVQDDPGEGIEASRRKITFKKRADDSDDDKALTHYVRDGDAIQVLP